MFKAHQIGRTAGLGAAAIVVSACLAISGLQSASAEDLPDVSDAVATISEVSQALLSQTSTNSSVKASDAGGNNAPTISVEGDSDTRASGIRWSVDYATGAGEVANGLTTLDTASANVQAYGQPTASRVRVLTAIASNNAPSSYSYTFDVPDGTVLTEGRGGFYLENGTAVLGIFFTS